MPLTRNPSPLQYPTFHVLEHPVRSLLRQPRSALEAGPSEAHAISNSPSGRCLETRLATNSPEGKTLGAVFATVGSSRCLSCPRRGQSSKPQCPLVKVGLPPDNPKPRRFGARRHRKTTGLFTRLVKQRSRWWYFIFAFAAT